MKNTKTNVNYENNCNDEINDEKNHLSLQVNSQLLEYLNKFHKETTERKLSKMEEWKKLPLDCVAAERCSIQLVAEANRLYPNKK